MLPITLTSEASAYKVKQCLRIALLKASHRPGEVWQDTLDRSYSQPTIRGIPEIRGLVKTSVVNDSHSGCHARYDMLLAPAHGT